MNGTISNYLPREALSSNRNSFSLKLISIGDPLQEVAQRDEKVRGVLKLANAKFVKP